MAEKRPEIRQLADQYNRLKTIQKNEPENYILFYHQFRARLKTFNATRTKMGLRPLVPEDILLIAYPTPARRLQRRQKQLAVQREYLVNLLSARVEQLRALQPKPRKSRIAQNEAPELGETLSQVIERIPKRDQQEARGYRRAALKWVKIRRSRDMRERLDLQIKCLEKEIQAIEAIINLVPKNP